MTRKVFGGKINFVYNEIKSIFSLPYTKCFCSQERNVLNFMKTRYIPFITFVAIALILVVGFKLGTTDKTDKSTLNKYEIGTVSKILSNEKYSIGSGNDTITTITASVKIKNAEEEKQVIQEYTSHDGRNNVDMHKGDKIVIMHTPDGATGYYGIFIDFVKTDMLIVLALSILIISILLAQIKGLPFLLKTLCLCFAVLILVVTPCITGSHTFLCVCFAVLVMAAASNLLSVKSPSASIFGFIFSVAASAVSALVSWGLVSLISLSNSFDLSIFNSTATNDYYVYSNDKAAVIAASVTIGVIFSAQVSKYFARLNTAAANEAHGFAKFYALASALFSRCVGSLGNILAVFALGITPILGMIYSNCRSFTAIINNEYVIYALCTIVISFAICVITIILAAILLSLGIAPKAAAPVKK